MSNLPQSSSSSHQGQQDRTEVSVTDSWNNRSPQSDSDSSLIFSKVDPSMFEKVSLILGDCTEPMLGLSITDQKVLQENVTIIIHWAGTVRFDEQMQQAVPINVTVTKDLLILSKKLKNLKAFVYVSTAYSNCHLNKIEEKFYISTIDDNKLITLTECLNNQQLKNLTPL
ncbi:fatty acyl-CoA reductase wat-like [Lycorma delicatula]|uniref:fatty acyl-CoA reductase wat-like n=1 Tax=Lycorma delicatula TaxID=130591 RepID=UPI003F51730B